MCPSGETALPEDCCYSKLQMWSCKNQTVRICLDQNGYHLSRVHCTCSRHDLADKKKDNLVLDKTHPLT